MLILLQEKVDKINKLLNNQLVFVEEVEGVCCVSVGPVKERFNNTLRAESALNLMLALVQAIKEV